MGQNDFLLALAVIFGTWDLYGIGANDVANSFSTAVNSGVFTMTQVALIAPIMEFLGAITVGAQVSSTIAKNIISSALFTNKEGLLQTAMVCALMGSSMWLQLANYLSMPVSTTHSIVGGVIGVGIAAFGGDAINWGFGGKTGATCATSKSYFAGICSTDIGFAPIAISWVSSPIIAAILGAAMFLFTKHAVLNAKDSFWRAVYVVPWIYGMIGSVMTAFIIYKGSGRFNYGVNKSDEEITWICFVVGICSTIVGAIYVSWWIVRTKFYGEDLSNREWLIHPCIRKRPIRAGFFLGGAANPSASTRKFFADDGATAPDTARAKVEDAGAAKTTFVIANLVAKMEEEQTNNLDLADVEVVPVPPEIAAAQAIAHKSGFIVRPMTETEKVLDEYKIICTKGTILDRLLLPVRIFFCHGVLGADGKERSVRTFAHDEMHDIHNAATHYDNRTEEFFRCLQMVTSCLASFSHGGNDIANAIGPLSVVYGIWGGNIRSDGKTASYAVEDWMLAYGGIMLGIGFITYGYHLMRSLGNNLTYHSPSRGYCMEFAAAITVMFASRVGLPISTTQCITGATIGVGMVSGAKAVNWRRVGTIFLSWLVTVPIVAVVSGLLFAFVAYSPTARAPRPYWPSLVAYPTGVNGTNQFVPV